jgi:TonB family protein
MDVLTWPGGGKSRLEKRFKKMTRLKRGSTLLHFLNDSRFPDETGLLRTGIISLLLHTLLIIFLVFNLKAMHTESGPSIYRVTLRTFPSQSAFSPGVTRQPVPAKTKIQKEKYKLIQETKQKDRAFDEKYLDQEIPSLVQMAVTKIPLEEQKQPPLSQEKEQPPIPLPMGEVSPSDKDLNIKREDNLPVHLSLSLPVEQNHNIIPGPRFRDGSGQGGPGSGGSGDGSGTGGGSGSGSGSGQGSFGWGGSGKGTGIGGGGRGGGGFGDGSGTGRGGSGGEGSGSYGTGVSHPRNAVNPKPFYPLEAREKGYEGEVLLRVEVLSNGWVGGIEVKKSSGYEVLDQSALSTVKKWKFIPARKEGVAIPVWVNIPIKFELQ